MQTAIALTMLLVLATLAAGLFLLISVNKENRTLEAKLKTAEGQAESLQKKVDHAVILIHNQRKEIMALTEALDKMRGFKVPREQVK